MDSNIDSGRRKSFHLSLALVLLLVPVVVAFWWRWPGRHLLKEVDSPTATSQFALGDAGQDAVPQFVQSTQITNSWDVADWDVNKAAWPTELFHDQAQKQLECLTNLLRGPGPFDKTDLATIVTADSTCRIPRPKNMKSYFRDGNLAVYRGPDEVRSTYAAGEAAKTFRGSAGFALALQQYCQARAEPYERKIEFKIVSIDMTPTAVTTKIMVHVSGRHPNQLVQQNDEWTCRWTVDAPANLPRIQSIENDLASYEEIVCFGTNLQLFSDLTGHVLGDNVSFASQLLPSTNFWLARLDSVLGSDMIASHGVAIADVNGDRFDDVYLCQPGGLPNRLFIQRPDGTGKDISADAGVNFCDASQHALFVDLDNDGDQDLAVLLENELVVLENDGQTQFEPRTTWRIRLNPNGLAAADVDGDSLLDIYILNHDSEQDRRLLGNPIPFHDANNGGANVLLRNLGQWQFADVTELMGLDQKNRRFTLAAAFEDFDNDGDADLYVANDFGRNNLYRNDLSTAGRFVDIAAQAGVEDLSAGMSVNWADYNNDGWMDLYVSNMFSSAGHRVAYQKGFQPNASDDARARFQRHARGNSLFEQVVHDGTTLGFRDVSVPSRVTMGRWAWASRFVDFNNDTWQDLLVANGFITNENTDDL